MIRSPRLTRTQKREAVRVWWQSDDGEWMLCAEEVGDIWRKSRRVSAIRFEISREKIEDGVYCGVSPSGRWWMGGQWRLISAVTREAFRTLAGGGDITGRWYVRLTYEEEDDHD